MPCLTSKSSGAFKRFVMSLFRLSGGLNQNDRTTGPATLDGRWLAKIHPASVIQSAYRCEGKRPLTPLTNRLFVLGGNGSSITVMPPALPCEAAFPADRATDC